MELIQHWTVQSERATSYRTPLLPSPSIVCAEGYRLIIEVLLFCKTQRISTSNVNNRSRV